MVTGYQFPTRWWKFGKPMHMAATTILPIQSRRRLTHLSWDMAAPAQVRRRILVETIKPGAVPFDAERQRLQAPHISFTIFSRGLLNHLVTRLYFEGEPANAGDVMLQCVPEERRGTLLARRESGEAMAVYHFDIVLQGAGETAFFNL